MRIARTALATLVPLALALSACGDDETVQPASTDSMTSDTMTDDSMTDDSMTDDTMTGDDMDGEEMMGEAWQSLTLTDVEGNEFTLNDFMGKPVFVENFATWCPTCRKQLGDTDTAAEELGDEAVFIALSVETDLSDGDVAEYAADNGFTHIRFAVMTPEFLAAITDHYGNGAINAPSTPKYVIDNHGVAGDMKTGTESADAIIEALRAAAM